MEKSSKSGDATPAKQTPEGSETTGAQSAPAVPTDILRQLTEGPKTTKKVAKNKQQSGEETAVGHIATGPQAMVDTTTLPDEHAAASEPVKHDETSENSEAPEDPETARAVDDIVAKEGDELLAAEDAKHEPDTTGQRSFGQKLKDFFVAWWRNKKARWITILVILAAIGGAAAVPKVRYGVLNTVGVRAAVTIIAVDDSTQLPLKNVTLSVAGQQATTDINGVARIDHLKLGPQTVTVRRIAFQTVTQHVVLGWGSNPLGNISLKAVGVQYTIQVNDYLSGKPIANVEATSNGVEALSDKHGKVTLTIDTEDADGQNVPVAIILSGYRTEQLSLPADATKLTNVQLVTDRKDVFISKQSGHYDLYKVDIDGKNKQVLLPATGNENENISLVMSPNGDQAALVSTRDNMRDSDGYLLTTLTLVNIATGNAVALDHAEQIQIVDWIDKRLIYQEASAGTSAANAQRYRLLSYDYVSSSRIQLATANQFNGVLTANSVIYYALASTDPNVKPVFAKVRPDGTGRQTVYNQEVWSMFRSDYNTVALQTPTGWANYSIQTGIVARADPPTSFVSRVYYDSPDGNQSLWVDTRDGQGALIAYKLADSKDAVVQTSDGLTYPVRWLNADTVIYSVANRAETAHYVLALSGGKPHKITDVTHTYGITQGN